MAGCSSPGGEAGDCGNVPFGVVGAPNVGGEGFAGVLIDDVQHLEAALVGGLVELEVQRPHMIRIPGP